MSERRNNMGFEIFRFRHKVIFMAAAALLLTMAAAGARAQSRPAATPPGATQPAGAEKPAALVIMGAPWRFVPSAVTIRAGQTVEWRNTSGYIHTVTAQPDMAKNLNDVALPPRAQPFNSLDIPPNGTFRHTFTVPGIYRYFCVMHESQGMVGEVVVKPAEGP